MVFVPWHPCTSATVNAPAVASSPTRPPDDPDGMQFSVCARKISRKSFVHMFPKLKPGHTCW